WRLASRRSARGRRLRSRWGAGRRRVGAPVLVRGRSALRLRGGPRGPVQTTGLVPVIGLVRPVVMLGLPGPVAMRGLVRPVATLGLVGPIAMLGLVGPTAAPAVVVSRIFGAGPTPGWLTVGGGHDA